MENKQIPGVQQKKCTEKEKLALEDHYSVFSVALLYFWPLHLSVNIFLRKTDPSADQYNIFFSQLITEFEMFCFAYTAYTHRQNGQSINQRYCQS